MGRQRVLRPFMSHLVKLIKSNDNT